MFGQFLAFKRQYRRYRVEYRVIQAINRKAKTPRLGLTLAEATLSYAFSNQ